MQKDQDGPISVKYGDIYKSGETKIEPYDLSTLPPLPPGYEALNNTCYKVTTTGTVSGPHIVQFRTPSVRDDQVFQKLRIFHIEPDTYDPKSPVWRDRTLLAPADRAPDFSSKAINASTEDLGVFVIARLTKEIASNTAKADLEVAYTTTVDNQISPAPIVYALKVSNKGPDRANEVGLVDSLSGHVTFLSVASSQGTCKEQTGTLYCKIGTLKPGEFASITIRVQPDEGSGSFPPEGMSIPNAASASAAENDPYPDNNGTSKSTLVFPDPNLAPTVDLVSPKDKTMVVGPSHLILKVTAQDVDGTIDRVEFFDNGRSIGVATSDDGKSFLLDAEIMSFGRHTIWAVATDNGGRTNESIAATLLVVSEWFR